MPNLKSSIAESSRMDTPLFFLAFVLAGGCVLIGFVTTVLARLFQYRSYMRGKFFSEYFPKALIYEILWMVIANLAIFGLGLTLFVFRVRSGLVLSMMSGIALAIGLVMLARAVHVSLQDVRVQLRRFGVTHVRNSVLTGPIRHVNSIEKLAYAPDAVDKDTDE